MRQVREVLRLTTAGVGLNAEGVDAKGLFGWIDNYCAGHPLDTVADAAFALISELQRRKR
jgi:hypothetical protein